MGNYFVGYIPICVKFKFVKQVKDAHTRQRQKQILIVFWDQSVPRFSEKLKFARTRMKTPILPGLQMGFVLEEKDQGLY